MEAQTSLIRTSVVVNDDGSRDVLFNSDDAAIESWLGELLDIEQQAYAMNAKDLSASFAAFFESLAVIGLPHGMGPLARDSLLQAWRFELGFAASTYERAEKTALTRRMARELSDKDIRDIADQVDGAFTEKLKAVLDKFPNQAEHSIRMRMTNELGYKPGRVQQSKPPRRKCAVLECGKEFQPTIKGNETRCRYHRH